MKILFFDRTLPHLLRDAEYPAGGWAVGLLHTLNGLAATGHRAGVLTWEGANAYVGRQTVCDLVESDDGSRGIPKLKLFYSWAPSILAAMRKYDPDVVVQSCSAFETGLLAVCSRILGIPFVHWTAADTDTDGRHVMYLDRRGQIGFRLGLGLCRFIICQNAYQLENIRKNYPRTPSDILYYAVEMPGSAAAPPSRPERRYVAWLGVFKRQKNMPLLLQIARKLPHVVFHVAGALPPHTDVETQHAIEELKTLKNVRFVGYVRRSGIEEFLNGAVALLSTSDFEGFSNTFLEAFAAGTPVVARTPVDPDSIIARHALGLVADDGAGLGDRIEKIWTMDRVAYEDMSRRCRAYVVTHHAPREIATRLVSMLETVVRKSGR